MDTLNDYNDKVNYAIAYNDWDIYDYLIKWFKREYNIIHENNEKEYIYIINKKGGWLGGSKEYIETNNKLSDILFNNSFNIPKLKGLRNKLR